MDLTSGTPSALTMSNFFDIPMIGIRNFLLPHLLLHPNEDEVFFSHTFQGAIDTRHIGQKVHQALGDMLSLYMRKILCETRLELSSPLPPQEDLWPGEDIVKEIPGQFVWERFNPGSRVPVTKHTCSLMGNKWRPLEPLPSSSPLWKSTEWNGKKSIASHEVGSRVNFTFSGCKMACVREEGKIVDAHIDSGFSHPQWLLLFQGLEAEDHILSCEVSADTATGGHEFRIIGIGSQ
ncbi:hypothetical protein P7C70_g2187, partial [Phenoliferia sp. Uapishka_3]